MYATFRNYLLFVVVVVVVVVVVKAGMCCNETLVFVTREH